MCPDLVDGDKQIVQRQAAVVRLYNGRPSLEQSCSPQGAPMPLVTDTNGCGYTINLNRQGNLNREDDLKRQSAGVSGTATARRRLFYRDETGTERAVEGCQVAPDAPSYPLTLTADSCPGLYDLAHLTAIRARRLVFTVNGVIHEVLGCSQVTAGPDRKLVQIGLRVPLTVEACPPLAVSLQGPRPSGGGASGGGFGQGRGVESVPRARVTMPGDGAEPKVVEVASCRPWVKGLVSPLETALAAQMAGLAQIAAPQMASQDSLSAAPATAEAPKAPKPLSGAPIAAVVAINGGETGLSLDAQSCDGHLSHRPERRESLASTRALLWRKDRSVNPARWADPLVIVSSETQEITAQALPQAPPGQGCMADPAQSVQQLIRVGKWRHFDDQHVSVRYDNLQVGTPSGIATIAEGGYVSEPVPHRFETATVETSAPKGVGCARFIAQTEIWTVARPDRTTYQVQGRRLGGGFEMGACNPIVTPSQLVSGQMVGGPGRK
jgi:hypothetical protein